MELLDTRHLSHFRYTISGCSEKYLDGCNILHKYFVLSHDLLVRKISAVNLSFCLVFVCAQVFITSNDTRVSENTLGYT